MKTCRGTCSPFGQASPALLLLSVGTLGAEGVDSRLVEAVAEEADNGEEHDGELKGVVEVLIGRILKVGSADVRVPSTD